MAPKPRAVGTDLTARWRRAADACADGDLPWDEAYCRQRQAGASAVAGRIDRAGLRRAHGLAVRLGAQPIIAAAEEPARVTRTRLVISEKPVSTHVSHMLRKTGTTNRVALSQLAKRLSAGRTPRREYDPPGMTKVIDPKS